MPFAVGGNARIRTNTPADNAYNALDSANKNISLRQLRLSTGKRINNAGDDVAGYITSRALQARNGALKAALRTVGDAQNISNILMDSLDNISGLLIQIKDSVASAASGSQGTDEKMALAKSAYRLSQQIQTVVDSTVFGGRQLLTGTFTANFVIGSDAANNLMSISIDMTTTNSEFNIENNVCFDLNAMTTNSLKNFAGVCNLDMTSLNSVSSTDLGIFSFDNISATLTSLADAIDNVTKVTSYVGGMVARLNSQEDLIKGQIVNYNAAISRIEDADVAQEQLELVKAQFLQQSSLLSLAQANQNPQAFLKLLQG